MGWLESMALLSRTEEDGEMEGQRSEEEEKEEN